MNFRGVRWLLVAKCVWIGAVISLWELGVGSCVTEPSCLLAGDYLFPLLILASFPSSVVLLPLASLVIDSSPVKSLDPVWQYTLLTLGLAIAGYIQWFHMIPAIFRHQKLTILSLGKPEVITLATCERSGTGVPPVERANSNQLITKPLPKLTIPILPFDARGLSPLERALGKRSRRKLTSVS